MGFFKTLIVGVDFSDYSKLVVRQALTLSERSGAHLVIVHATTGTTEFLGSTAVQEMTLKYAETLRQALPRHYKLKHRDDVEFQVHYGYPEEVLVKTSGQYPDPLIIVGHRGHGVLGRFFLGSTAERLALHSPVPVWIHRGRSIVAPTKVLVPHDLSENSDRAVSEAASRLIRSRKGLEIFFVKKNRGVSNGHGQDVKRIRHKHRGYKFFQSYGDPVSEIVKHSKKFDVVALTPRNRKSPLPILGSVTAKLVRAMGEPIVIFPSAEHSHQQ